ncbi:MAG: hypothetical protein ACD_79C00167G0006, partial [uncultured bacterium]
YQKEEKLVLHEKKSQLMFPVLKKVKQGLEDGVLVRKIALDENEKEIIKELNLLTAKSVLYVGNVGENDIEGKSEMACKVRDLAKSENAGFIAISGKIECELSDLEEQERIEYLQTYGLNEPGKYKLINSVFNLLGLITYFTAGEKEVRAWDIPKNTKAPQAAGKIHSDFERGFIAAEVIHYNDLIKSDGYPDAKNKGLVRLEGKDYIVKDGDCCIFRFSV